MNTLRFSGKEGRPIVLDLSPLEAAPAVVRIEGPEWVKGIEREPITIRVIPVFMPYTTGLAVIEGSDLSLYVTPRGELLFVRRPDMEPQELVTVIAGETVTLRRLDVSQLAAYNKDGSLA